MLIYIYMYMHNSELYRSSCQKLASLCGFAVLMCFVKHSGHGDIFSRETPGLMTVSKGLLPEATYPTIPSLHSGCNMIDSETDHLIRAREKNTKKRFTNFTMFRHFFLCSAKVVGGYFQATVTVRCLDGDWKDAVFVGEVCRDKAGRTDKLRLVKIWENIWVFLQNFLP